MTTQRKISLFFESLSEQLLITHLQLEYEIAHLCYNFSTFLIEKNNRYGDSALSPIQIFSKTPPSAQISNRLDDKLNRIKNNSTLLKNDLSDTLGYLTLLSIQNDYIEFEYKNPIKFNYKNPIQLFSKFKQYPNVKELDMLLSSIKSNSTLSKTYLHKTTENVALLLIYNEWTTFDELLD